MFALASMVAMVVGVGACKDPNPTFVFDAATDGAKDGAGDGSSQGGFGAGAAPGGGGGAGGERRRQAASGGGGRHGRDRWIGRRRRCLVIRYTRHTVFLVALLALSGAARAQSAPPAAPAPVRRPSPRLPPPRRAAPAGRAAAPPRRPPPPRGAGDGGGGAPGRHRTGGAHRVAQTRAARGGGRQAGEGGAQADHRRQGLLDGAARQVVRAQDSRPHAGRRAFLPRQRRAPGQRHLPDSPFSSCALGDVVLDRRLPIAAGVRRHGADPGRVRRSCTHGNGCACASANTRHRSAWNACRATPIFASARARARSEPDQHARHRRSAVGRRRGRNRPLRDRRLQRRARDQFTATTPTSITRSTSMGRLFFQPFKAESLRGFGNLGFGLSVGPAIARARRPDRLRRRRRRADRAGAVPDGRDRTRSFSTWRRPPTRRAR